jgi:hypothetical protein
MFFRRFQGLAKGISRYVAIGAVCGRNPLNNMRQAAELKGVKCQLREK